MKELQGRVAVVTGAAGGIGRALVNVFVNAGMKVVLAGPNQKRLWPKCGESQNLMARLASSSGITRKEWRCCGFFGTRPWNSIKVPRP